jgi:hypothetical protein
MEREFVTADVYLIAIIQVLLQIQPTYRVHNGRTLGVFPVSDELYKCMNDFNSGVTVNALEFVAAIRKVRAELITRRNSEGEGHNG